MKLRKSFAVFPMLAITACGVTPKDCEFFDVHFSRSAPVDLGSGLISYDSYPVAFSSGSFRFQSRNVMDCAARQKITFVLVSDTDPGTPNPEDYFSGEAGEEIVAIIDSGNFESRGDLVAKAEKLGIPVRVRDLDREECGCAAYYAELLGDQEPARERDA